DPKDVPILRFFQDGIRELLIDRFIGLPKFHVEFSVFHKIVVEGPYGTVAAPIVKPFDFLLGEVDLGTAMVRENLRDFGIKVGRGLLTGQARPSDPKTVPALVHRFHSGGQAPYTGYGLYIPALYP